MKKKEITYNDTVKEAIITAVLKLIQKKELSRISVSEIICLAGVSRSSFYRNFESKEQVLLSYIQTKYRDYFAEELSAIQQNKTIPSDYFLLKRFRFVKDNKDFFSSLAKNHLLEYIFYHLDPDLNHFLSENVTLLSPYYVAMYSGASAAIIQCWIDRKFQETEEELLALLKAYETNR